MNSDEERARNARKRAKQRAKRRGGGNFWRCQLKLTFIENRDRREHKEKGLCPCLSSCSPVLSAMKVGYRNNDTGWETRYRDLPLTYNKDERRKPITSLGDKHLMTTHDMSSTAVEHMEVQLESILDRIENSHASRGSTFATLIVEKDGEERRTTWRVDPHAEVADVIAAICMQGPSLSHAISLSLTSL